MLATVRSIQNHPLFTAAARYSFVEHKAGSMLQSRQSIPTSWCALVTPYRLGGAGRFHMSQERQTFSIFHLFAFVAIAAVNAFAVSVGYNYAAWPGGRFTGTHSILSSVLLYFVLLRWNQTSNGFRFCTIAIFVSMTAAMFFPDLVIPRSMRYIANDDREAERFFRDFDPTAYPSLDFRYVNPAHDGYRGSGQIVVTGKARSQDEIDRLIERIQAHTTLRVRQSVVELPRR